MNKTPVNYPVRQEHKTIITLDYETRWMSKAKDPNGEGYTLTSMTTEEYIRDPRFKAFGCCLHELGTTKPIQWYSHAELPRIFSTYDWSKTAVLAHNAMFDAGILSMIYDVHPCFIYDSLSMARALRGVEVGNSLAKLAAAFGLSPKGNAVHSTDGLNELTPAIEQELAEYCKHDVWLCEQIFSKLLMGLDPVTETCKGEYPPDELALINMTIKMFTEPRLVLDVPMLEKAVVEDAEKLQAALDKCGVNEVTLGSNGQFVAILESLGVPAPMKTSKTTGLPALALAKTDALFQAMLNGDNEDVALLCEARIRVKSTQARTRATRFIGIAGRGALPIPLNYYGAGTGRWAASGKINMQNMKRGSFLRKSIMAPPDHSLIVGDLSQIEPRVLAWLADYEDMLDIFRSGGDPYATFGAQMFNVPGMTKESHPLLRQSAKSALLGAGYQLGFSAFAGQLLVGFLGAPPLRYTKKDARMLGVTQHDVQKFLNYADNVERMLKIARTCTDEALLIHCVCAKAIIDKYRAAAEPVGDFWKMLQELIPRSLLGGEVVDYKCLQFREGEIELPNGMCLLYPDLRAEKDEKGRVQFSYRGNNKRVTLHSGKIANNVTQGVARIVMTDGLLRVEKRLPVLGTVHDEGIFLVRDADAAPATPWVKRQMVKVPLWMPGIPLDADVHYGKRYGSIK